MFITAVCVLFMAQEQSFNGADHYSMVRKIPWD